MELNIAKFRSKIFYGWFVVGMAALGIFFSGPGQTYSISVFINSYIKEFGWSRSMVSSLYSSATLISGLFLFIMGRFVDKYGQKRMSIIAALMLGVACLWNSFVIGPTMLFFGFFMLRFFGQGSMTLIPNTLVPQWFIKKRALALSIMSLGGVTASALFPPLNNWLILTYSWQHAWRFWAVLLWVIFIPLVIFVMHNKPEDIGLLPDDEKLPRVSSSNQQDSSEISAGNNLNDNFDELDMNDISKGIEKSAKLTIEEESWTLKEAMTSRSFWLMLFCQAVPSMIGTGLVFHLVSILGVRGLSQTTTSFVLSIMAIVAFPVTFLAGYILDRVKVHYVMAFAFILEFITIILVLNTSSSYIAIVYGVISGVMNGFFIVSGGVLWPNYFGREHLGSIRGTVMTALVIGSAFGPLPFGFAYDYFGGYNEILLFMLVFPILGAIASLASPAPEKLSIL